MVVFQRFLPYVFLIFSLMYLVAHTFGPFPGEELIKTVPCLILATIVVFRVPGWQGKVLAVALVLSAVGDYLLGIRNGNEQTLFVYGLGSFLLAHIAYIVVFARNLKKQPSRYALLGGIVIFGAVMCYFLIPKLGEMLIPVMVYMAVILTMGITAAFREMKTPLLMLGALLFIVSDSTIAVNKFLMDDNLPYAFFIIMITYYLAQYMIARAFVLEYASDTQ